MPIRDTTQAPLEQLLQTIVINAWDAGLLSDLDRNDCPINGSPDCQNVRYTEEGVLVGRGGWVKLLDLISTNAQPDGFFTFDDVNFVQRLIVFAGGNMYDISGLVLGATFNGVYQAGQRVAGAALGGNFVYSDGTSIYTVGGSRTGQRVYNGTVDQPNLGSGALGSIDPPAFRAACPYNGALVYGYTTQTNGIVEPHTIRWCNVMDITTVLGTDQQACLNGAGGYINMLAAFGQSTAAVAPINALIVGKTKCVLAEQGALGSLQEKLLRCPGVLDGYTWQEIPWSDGAVIAFLARDKGVYVTDGVTCVSIVKNKCRFEMRNWITDQLTTNITQRFYAGLNPAYSQYILDVGGGRQYAFDYEKQAWARYVGWPQGIYVGGVNIFGVVDPLYVVHQNSGKISFSQADSGSTDNGNAISPYWKTPYLRGQAGDNNANGGDPFEEKIWNYYGCEYATDMATIVLTFTGRQGLGNPQSVTLPSPGGTPPAPPSDYDEAGVTYDGAGIVYASSSASAIGYTNMKKFNKIPYAGTTGAGMLQSTDMQVTISQGSAGIFRINSLTLKLLPRGISRVNYY